MPDLRRREFITLLGGAAAAWPLVALAQRSTSVIGVLSGSSLVGLENRMANFRRGLAETGYVEGRNLTIESRWAEEQYDRLPTLAKELVDRRVDVIFAVGAVRSVLAAKAATSAIPIVFELGSDPLEFGLVQSFNRPGGNVTGVSTFGRELLAKRTEVLRELIPKNGAVGLLVNPQNPNTRPSLSEMQALANAGGWPLLLGEVNTVSDLGRAFAKLAEQRARGIVHATDVIFSSQRKQMVALAAQHAIPVIFTDRETVQIGGLMSYGGDIAEAHRDAGVMVGRILHGAKPADLPVMLSTKVQLVINLKTATALGLDVPATLLARADEVIE